MRKIISFTAAVLKSGEAMDYTGKYMLLIVLC